MTINLEKSLEIDAPIDQVYEQWADFNAYPRFMPHVLEVQPQGDQQWVWQAERGGQAASWNVAITGQEPGRSISWRTDSPDFNSTSTIQLTPLDEGARTSVLFTAHYPQGPGPNGTAMQIAAEMEQGLAQLAAILTGQPLDNAEVPRIQTPDQTPKHAQNQDQTSPAADIDHLEQTLETATEALVGSVMKAFDTPLSQFGQLIWDMEKQFTDFIWGNLDNRRVSAFSGPGTWSPQINLSRQGDMLVAIADLPGYTSDHLHVEIRDGRLLVSGERSLPSASQDHDERQEERFNVAIDLTETVDSQQVDARLTEEGRLEISLPIKQAATSSESAKPAQETTFWGA